MTYFFLQKKHWPSDVLIENLSNPANFFLSTPRNWVLQTYLLLSQKNNLVKLVDNVPPEGVIVYFVGDLNIDYKPNEKQILIAISADSNASTYAQMRIVQNRQQTRSLSDSYFIRHWPQPGISVRDKSRKETFQNVAFFGDDVNLDSYFRSEEWLKELQKLGLRWNLRNASHAQLADYSNVDAVVAVRSFNKKGFIRKPASKLYNAWKAGVPAILGQEYAFQEEKKTELDYIEVKKPKEVISALKKLKDNFKYREEIVANGYQRIKEISENVLINDWSNLLSETAQIYFAKWVKLNSNAREKYFFKRLMQKKMRGLHFKICKITGNIHNCI